MSTPTRAAKIAYIDQVFEHNSDFVSKEASLYQVQVHVCYIGTLVQYEESFDTLIARLSHLHGQDDLIDRIAKSPSTRVNVPLTELVSSILHGMLIVFPQEGYENIVLEPSAIDSGRSISEAQTENPIQTALDAFTEDMYANISLIRRKMRIKELHVETYTLGTDLTREVAVLYVDGQADPKVVQLIHTYLNENAKMDISDVQGLLKALKQPSYSLVPTYTTSELPSTTKHNLMDGRVVIFLDHFPFSLSFPSIISDFWDVKTDKDQPALYMYLYRIIRITSLIIAISMPGLYVVLNSVNPELLRIQLAVSITNSREGVPYPVLVELLMMLLIIEMVIEASIRLPKSIGPTITMVGGIILGQAVVQARLVSYFLIIVVAGSTIAHFTMGTYMNTVSIRLYKYVVIILSALYGILGLMSSIVLFCFYLGTITTFEVPYLSLSTKRGKSK
ncbi:spore germination protein [Paenibacillus planticolens]|uniref:Spore gernimation protein GerA n=1 Tax=Paenibacillus planticolens TaxID=2654976 RepID=A0ABX1ZM69_9BACL|nr:spore germination protein [Paenibacillus planticolens]NOV01167.1 spore gernimation protein GerA [Paenibacillus planticolens]